MYLLLRKENFTASDSLIQLRDSKEMYILKNQNKVVAYKLRLHNQDKFVLEFTASKETKVVPLDTAT